MDLEDVDGHAASGRELLVADMALEVLGFLMLHQDLLVVEFAIAVITPHLRGNSLLLLPHDGESDPSRIGFVTKVVCPAAMAEEEEARARIQKRKERSNRGPIEIYCLFVAELYRWLT